MAFGQNTMSFEIANNPYTYAFDKAKKRFSICTKKGIQDICVSKIVTATDPFAVSIELREFTTTALNQFEYNIYGVFLKPDSISNYSYTVPEINLDTATLINDNKAQITLTNALKAHSFTVVKNESVYTITANKNDFPTLPVITKTTTTNIQANAATFKSDIAQQIMSALNSANSDRSKAIEAQQKTAIETHLATFYKRKIAPSKPYNYEDTIKLKTAATPSVEESFYIYSLFENGSFYLRTCDENCTDSVKTYGAFPLSISEKDFVDKMLKQHNQFAQTTDNETVLKALYTKLATKISAQKVVLAEKKETDKLNSLLDSIVNIETRYSGVMTLAPSFGLYKQPNDSLTNEEKRKYRRTVEEERFIVHSATLRFFNNKVDNAAVVGTFEKRPTDTIILYNRQWSLPLRAFANDSQSNKYRDKWNGEELNYYYSDILTYSPEEQYHYAVANTEITLTPGKPVKIKARNVNDYFTGVFFSDFLGLNSNNSNSLIVAEGRVRIPWHFRTIGKHTFFDNLSAYLSVNLFSGFESSSRRINLDDVVVASAADFDETDNRLFITNNFDLLSNNNVDAGLQLALYSVEWKGANTNIHFRYGA
ncbi:MAG: hypothetical protein CMC75_11930, partial [Flavobacteriaceae bacterium]|nr:hypothetical protein [Flavobacteriaceae bacterium]